MSANVSFEEIKKIIKTVTKTTWKHIKFPSKQNDRWCIIYIYINHIFTVYVLFFSFQFQVQSKYKNVPFGSEQIVCPQILHQHNRTCSGFNRDKTLVLKVKKTHRLLRRLQVLFVLWLLVHLLLVSLFHVLQHQVRVLLHDADWTPHGRKSTSQNVLKICVCVCVCISHQFWWFCVWAPHIVLARLIFLFYQRIDEFICFESLKIRINLTKQTKISVSVI